jgi:aspartyl-tRNA(Asn)/glutamyl-tRNA(Gln) amidotransferase subunit A
VSVPAHHRSIASAGAALRSGALTATGLTDHYLARIARYDGALGSYITVDAAGARTAAQAADARFAAGAPLGPLDGIPIAVKDNIDVAGLPTTAGIGARKGRVAATDATVVAQLKAAGAVVLGKLNLHEAALGATNENAVYGRCHNPHRLGYTPGGSSGGSGAAVAAGLCAAALGTDTMGSVRIPASYCGVYGLKPTHGAIPADGLVALAHRLDAIGILARTVSDVAALWSVIGSQAQAPRITRVATLNEVDAHDMQRGVRSAYQLAQSLLKGLELDLRERSLGGYDFGKVRRYGLVIAEVDAAQIHAEDLRDRAAGFSEDFRRFIAFGAKLTPADVAYANGRIDEARAVVLGLLAESDCILMPTAPQAAFSFDAQVPADQADFTAIANMAGCPAISVPCGWDADGLPVGVQLLGRPGSEAALLELGGRLDAAARGYQFPANFD